MDYLRKVRGVLGLGGVGAGIGALYGAARLLLSGEWRWGWWDLLLEMVSALVIRNALSGFVIGAGLGMGLLAFSRRSALVDIPLWKAALYGATAGALVLPLQVALYAGISFLWAMPMITAAKWGATWGIVGAVSSASAVALAQRAESRELGVVEEVRALASD